MIKEITKLLDQLSRDELLQLKDIIVKRLEANHKNNDTHNKRHNKRIDVALPGNCVIEREKEFFYKEHRINILDLSSSGIRFAIPTTIYKNDVVNVSFRSPVTAEKKFIDCQAVRVSEIKEKARLPYEVAARAIDKEELKAYRESLRKR